VSKESQYDYIMRTHDVYFPRRRWELAQKSGVSLDTLNKVFQRQTKNPKASTVQSIFDVLSDCERKADRVKVRDTKSAEAASLVPKGEPVST
jgi:predicted transcriptional regulator